jgi:hypothetical protein
VARSKLPIATGIGGIGAGYLLGKLSSHNLEQIIEGGFQLADKHEPFALFARLLVGITVGMAVWLIRLTIQTKDREIERLVQDRNKFQAIVLRDRRSTTDE